MTREKRRQYGSGSVYQRGDGRWIGAITAGWTAEGKRRRVTVTAKTEAACKRAVERKKADIARDGAPAVGGSGRVTVKSWSDTWLDRITHTVRPKTFSSHRFTVKHLIVPVIGHRRLDLLTPGDVHSVIDSCRKKELADSTLVRTRAVLMKMLRDAVSEGHSVPPLVLKTKGAKVTAGNRGALDKPDLRAILTVIEKQPDRSRWLMALHTGARQGECIGLTWDRVDFTRDVIDISWQLQGLDYSTGRPRIPLRYEYKQLFGALSLVRPKGKNRIVKMSHPLRGALLEWRDRAPASPHDLVWPREDGQPLHGNADRAAWKAILSLAGASRPYQLHELRHTAATIMLEGGVDPEVIKRVLGHADVLVTMAYAHINQDMETRAVAALAQGLTIPPASSSADSP